MDLVYNRYIGGYLMRFYMEKFVNIHQVKTHLSRVLARVMGGEEIIIAKSEKPVARLVPFSRKPAKRIPGSVT